MGIQISDSNLHKNFLEKWYFSDNFILTTTSSLAKSKHDELHFKRQNKVESRKIIKNWYDWHQSQVLNTKNVLKFRFHLKIIGIKHSIMDHSNCLNALTYDYLRTIHRQAFWALNLFVTFNCYRITFFFKKSFILSWPAALRPYLPKTTSKRSLSLAES